MMDSCLMDLFEIFPNHTVYCHNLGGFDSLYMVQSLYRISDVKPLFKDNKLISMIATLNVKNGNDNKKTKLIFHDSLMLLPLSLDRLIKTFSISTPKLVYPYAFVTSDNLKYIGKLPDYKYFDNSKLTLSDYNLLLLEYKDKV